MVVNAHLFLMSTVMAAVDLDLAIGLGQLSVNFLIHGLMTLREDADVCQQEIQVT